MDVKILKGYFRYVVINLVSELFWIGLVLNINILKCNEKDNLFVNFIIWYLWYFDIEI